MLYKINVENCKDGFKSNRIKKIDKVY